MSVIYRGSTLDLGGQVRKLFEGLGWFSREVVNDLLDGEKEQMYTIRFTDGEEETWSAHDVKVNFEAGPISIGYVVFQFIQKIVGVATSVES